MTEARTSLFRHMFARWYVKAIAVIVAIPASLGLYDVCCNQFGWPKLPLAWQNTGATVPWWGWLLILQAAFILALADYVRRLSTLVPREIGSGDNSDIQQQIVDIGNTQEMLRKAINTIAEAQRTTDAEIKKQSVITNHIFEKARQSYALTVIEDIEKHKAVIKGRWEWTKQPKPAGSYDAYAGRPLRKINIAPKLALLGIPIEDYYAAVKEREEEIRTSNEYVTVKPADNRLNFADSSKMRQWYQENIEVDAASKLLSNWKRIEPISDISLLPKVMYGHN